MTTAVVWATVVAFSLAQAAEPAAAPATTRPASADAARRPVKAAPPDRAELERRFAATLTNATLKGTWQMTNEAGLAGKGPLGAAAADQYTIGSVEKLDDERWTITARIQYGEKDVNLPVTVRVVWAGDTPVITLDEMWLPMLGKYSARVMIQRDFYAGTWFGTNYGGVMSGQIVRGAPTSQPATASGPVRAGG